MGWMKTHTTIGTLILPSFFLCGHPAGAQRVPEGNPLVTAEKAVTELAES